MLRSFPLCLALIALCGGLTGCIATKVATTTVGVAAKATVMTVKTTGKVAKGTAGLLIPDGDDEQETEYRDGSEAAEDTND